MTVTAATFRAAFPEFASIDRYTPGEIGFWLDLGTKLLANTARWGNLIDYGLQLFIAHNLSLQAQAATGGSGAPGQIQGPVTSASVDKVSYSRDPNVAMDPKNGHWNLSTYGLRYIQLVRMVGAGPVQVGVDPCATNYGGMGGAWPGPPYDQWG